MGKKLISPLWIIALTVLAIVLPIALCILAGTAALLTTMGDTAGGVALGRIALGGGMLWAVDLICLVLALAVRAVGDGDKDGGA